MTGIRDDKSKAQPTETPGAARTSVGEPVGSAAPNVHARGGTSAAKTSADEPRPRPMSDPSPAAATSAGPAPSAVAPAAPTTAAPAPATAPTSAPAPAGNGRPRRGPIARFLRSLFSHLLFAGVAVSAVLGYLYHGVILRDVSTTVCAPAVLGQWMGDPGSTVSKPVATGTASTSAANSAAPTPPAAAVASRPVQTVAVPAVATGAGSAAPAAAAQSGSEAAKDERPVGPPAPVGVQTSRAEKSAQPAPAASATAMEGAARSADLPPQRTGAAPTPAQPAPASRPRQDGVAAAPGPATPDAPRSTAAPEARDSGTSLRDAWHEARQAYAAGSPDAVEVYRRLAARFPDVADITGELGNIYYQKGDREAAAASYLETAMRLVRAGQEPRAACLVPILKQLDPARAAAVETVVKGSTCPSSAGR